ncbi:MAG: GNAT family N-acetyltransferase [Candidatus Omnitrophota bacterium]|nr:GNAT family N-acetyltransferase [Candidatus Omnitrophota bacterium]
MKIAEISDYNGFSALKEEWKDLLSRSIADNIFLTHEWMDSLIRHFYKGDRLLILSVFDGQRLAGIAPLVIKKDQYLGLKLRKLCFIGASISDRMDFILDGDRDRIITLIFDYIMSLRKEWDVVDLEEIAECAGNVSAIKGYLDRFRPMRIIGPDKKSFFINFNQDKDFIFHKFSKKFNKRLNKLHNREAGLKLGFHRYTNGDIDPENIFSAAMSIESKSWKGRKASGIFSKENTREFHREIINRFSKNKWIDCSILDVNGKQAAYIYNYLYKTRSYSYSMAFDSDYNLISAGTILMLWALKDSALRDISEFDFARGEGSWKSKFTQDYRTHTRVRVFKNTPYCMFLYFMQGSLMPFMRNIQILHRVWMKAKEILRWE